MGERFRRILDWSFSSVGDDVSSFTSKLTEMECRLFERGALAAKAFWYWKMYGNRRLPAPHANNNITEDVASADTRAVTPDQDNTAKEQADRHHNKRRRVT
jgi:hypothetical protein